MMLQTMGIMMMSLVVGKMIITLILDGLFQGKLSNLIIGILMKMNLSQAEADVIYQNIFRANRDVSVDRIYAAVSGRILCGTVKDC